MNSSDASGKHDTVQFGNEPKTGCNVNTILENDGCSDIVGLIGYSSNKDSNKTIILYSNETDIKNTDPGTSMYGFEQFDGDQVENIKDDETIDHVAVGDCTNTYQTSGATHCNYQSNGEISLGIECDQANIDLDHINGVNDFKQEVFEEKEQIIDSSSLLDVPFIFSEKLIKETDNELISETFKYSCEHCGDSYLFRMGFNQHMLQKHKIHLKDIDYVKYSSKIIVKQPKRFPALIRMSRNISSDMSCLICKQSFKSKDDLKEHRKIHKTYVCHMCGAAFMKKGYLADHIVKHFSHREYVCEICNASFKQRHALTTHRNCHKTFRDQTCEICGTSFKDKNTLRTHIKLKHTDDRNYACSKCSFTFKLKSFLNKHFLRKHTERTKDFNCDLCGMAYYNKTSLVRHVTMKHFSKTPKHVCTVCAKSFTIKSNLDKHLESIHELSTIK